MLRRLPLIGEAFRKGTRKVIDRPVAIVLVVTGLFAGRERVQRVVNIVVPLRDVLAGPPTIVTRQVMRGIVVVLENEVHVARVSEAFVYGCCQCFENVGRALVANRMEGGEGESVKAIFL